MARKISVVMSTYNETENELKEAIESILSQTFKDFEFIIVLDNPKNDVHKQILNQYKLRDNRIRIIINEKNIGLAASLNKGILSSKSKYIARMDADDISLSNRIEKEYEYLEKHNDIDIISTNKIEIDENGNVINNGYKLPISNQRIKKLLEIESVICHSAAMFRREKIVEIGVYRLFPASQDYDLWLRASSAGLNFAIIDEGLIKYRIRDNNISNKNPLKQFLLREYIKELYKERKKTGKDSFSTENLDKYLNKNKAFDQVEIEKFKKAIKYLYQAKEYIKQKQILKSLHMMFKVLFAQKKSKKLLFSYIKSHILKG